MLTASQILSIPIDNPSKLFSKIGFKTELALLQSVWHPDKSKDPEANVVFDHIRKISRVAKDRIEQDNWVIDGELTFREGTSTYTFRYLKKSTIEVGMMYIGHEKVIFVFDEEFNDLFENSVKRIQGIKYTNDHFKKEFQRFLPDKTINKYNSDIGNILTIDKTKDIINLGDLLDFLPERKLHPRHVAWIVSATMNVLSFCAHSNICHNAITPESLFISTANHSVHLLGGWWYATPSGSKLIAIPTHNRPILPNKLFVDKIAKFEYDVIGLKATAIQCLGDTSLTGSKLRLDECIPPAMLHWLRQPPTSNTRNEYTNWIETLHDSYGKRKFFRFETNITKLYKDN